MTAPPGLDRQVAASLRRAGFSSGGVRLVVAASGGPDSTALLRSLHGLRDEFRLGLHVAHLNHDFRGAEADLDAAFVQRLADGLGLPCSIDQQDPIAYQKQRGVSSFEQAAREMRYAFLAAVAASAGATAVALGHTADDQAETVLLHLLRGSGLHGLRGMTEVAEWPWPKPRPGPLLYRPLLDATKADTVAYCRSLGRTYRQDSGNYMWRFTRNKVRHDLIPRLSRDYNPRVREALLRLSRAALEDLDFIEVELSRHWSGIAEESEGAVSFGIEALAALHAALQRHALRRAYAHIAGDARGLNEAHLDAMLSLIHGQPGNRSLDLPRGTRVRREGSRIELTRNAEPVQLPMLDGEHEIALPAREGQETTHEFGDWRLILRVVEPGQPNPLVEQGPPHLIARLNRDALGGSVRLRTRRPGDRFQPLGMTGTKKLQDFFTDSKIPRDRRDGVPLLVCQRGIAWVAGHRVAAWAMADGDGPELWVSLLPTDHATDV